MAQRRYALTKWLVSAGADKRMLEALLQNEDHVVPFHPELALSFQAIPYLWKKWDPEKHPGILLWLDRMCHVVIDHDSRQRYTDNGVAKYHYWNSTAYFFNTSWLWKEILPFDYVRQIISLVHRRGDSGVMEEDPVIKLTRIDQSPYWPVFWPEKSSQPAWIVTRLLTDLLLPTEICPHCGRGGDMEWVRSKKMLLGAVWGIGSHCLGDGYVVFEATRKSDLEGKI